MTEDHQEEVWQPRFYAVLAVSTGMIGLLLLFLGDDTWISGLMVGFSMAGSLACAFLSVQHRALVEAYNHG